VHIAHPHRIVTNTVLPISSSEIRRRLGEGRTVKFLLPDRVLAYIGDKKLYG
jgi:nicotinate-nucleotide adenylyltransferase